jgi:hypothetical protein
MRITIMLVALMLACPAWAQASAAGTDAAKPAETPKAAETAKPGPKAASRAKKASTRRQQDARHCLQRASNDAIIRCAEEYL